MFFKQNEIERVKSLQEQDLFSNLMKVRESAKFESSTAFGGTKINIASFAPKPKVNISADQKGLKKIKVRRLRDDATE
jgi:hypothetical protein